MSYGKEDFNGCLDAIGVTALYLVLAVIFDLIFAYPAQLLWNWLVPEIFGGPVISYWQAFGLQLLFSLFMSGNTTQVKND